ncbi:MAG: hypothetical protein LIQ31_05600, partial [Planctomycetes bacterium]|nr:hypothetical protein [Planctomycetota bacterium]
MPVNECGTGFIFLPIDSGQVFAKVEPRPAAAAGLTAVRRVLSVFPGEKPACRHFFPDHNDAPPLWNAFKSLLLNSIRAAFPPCPRCA